MRHQTRKNRARLLCGAGVVALAMLAGRASAEQAAKFNIAPQPLADALNEFARQSGRPVMFTPEVTGSITTGGATTTAEPGAALSLVLANTGLSWRRSGDTFLIVKEGAAEGPQGASAGGGADTNVVQELVVTAQKKSENIQVVPIAISAFTQQDLTTRQVTGGPDLMTQVPNMTFTKTNFSSYSIQIRGIGTQAISATTDAAVAVAFNNTPFIRNRFFEQEFYDLERVEVLRGPQGTLYGRNATAGVVNILSAKPTFDYQAKASVDVANYSGRRLEGMVNLPLVEDKVALRIAGAWTKRDGYDTNQITGSPIDGRDLWSTRVSLRIEPNDKVKANLIWEHFQEDDDRLRSGKQLCKTDEVTQVGGLPVDHFHDLPNGGQGGMYPGVSFSQGCLPESLYSPQSFQTPNGLSLPYYYPLSFIFLPTALTDPYLSRTQSSDLRTIESTVDPQYRAKSDLAEVQLSFDLGHGLTLASETAYDSDDLFSLEDFNRFNTAPDAWDQARYDNTFDDQHRAGVLNGGVFCDPQIGCADRLVAEDLSTAKSRQFSQEFRLSSNYDGKFNFSLGANFLRYDTEDKYYVFINSLSLISAISPYGRSGPLPPYVPGVSDNHECLINGPIPGDPTKVYPVVNCTFMDTNPIGSLNDQGHNYFLSKNPYKLISYAGFGEVYYNVTDDLKLTGGLRWTVDRKEAPRIPSWLLASNTAGYPVAGVVRQEWSKPTGRIAIDWKPRLSFTDQTLLYASFARGYKAGGANPPGFAYVYYSSGDVAQAEADNSATRPKTFQPEYVNAFELGAKNTLLDGRATLNLSAFYYDYTGYQISEIVDRSAFNQNFDAKIWGAEIEADWRPMKNLRLGFKGGYEKTRLADGSKAVDLMDRTAGNSDWVVVKPFPTFASNCILPKWLFAGSVDGVPTPIDLGGVTGGNPGPCELAYVENHDPVTNEPYVDLSGGKTPPVLGPLSMYAYHPDYPGWDPATAPNHGEGFYKDLSGHELPNAPHFTATVTADYTIPLPHDWLATLHGDFYYQSEAWTRIFNTPGYDRLKAYSNVNLAAIFTNEAAGWRVMAYVKNVFDKTAITGAFLNSDDTGLTTNVFLTEPRLYGLRVTKEWTGAPLLGAFGPRKAASGPSPLTIELGGQVQRFDAPNRAMRPGFTSAFPSVLDDFGAAQNQDLDWGDGRDLKLTYRPDSGPWMISAAVRIGRTNAADPKTHLEQPHDPICGIVGKYASYCAGFAGTAKYQATPDWSDDQANRREDYKLVDFSVGRDVGVGSGGLNQSSLSIGLNYAQFRSATATHMQGIPDWNIPPGFLYPVKYHVTHTRYDSALDADREFKGAGPVLSWEASRSILGNDGTGRLGVDWALSGGVLFGKQKARIAGSEQIYHYDRLGTLYNGGPTQVDSRSINLRRSRGARVPTLAGSLGLSYRIDRIGLSAGYRWERYFNAIDGGYAEHRSDDRTIDGPYFKVSVGFGG